MTKTVCDICGEEMATIQFMENIRNMNFCMSSHGRTWDICTDCRVSLNRWMTMHRERKEEDKE